VIKTLPKRSPQVNGLPGAAYQSSKTIPFGDLAARRTCGDAANRSAHGEQFMTVHPLHCRYIVLLCRCRNDEETMSASILVVEDDRPIRDLVTDILTDAGFKVSSTATLGAARALVTSGQDEFQLILLAVRLPDGDGLAWCVELRAAGFTAPIIVVSGNRADLHRARKVGATAILKKPFTIGYLLERIEDALAQE
jgi:CheY-like chemotaxis protein